MLNSERSQASVNNKKIESKNIRKVELENRLSKEIEKVRI